MDTPKVTTQKPYLEVEDGCLNALSSLQLPTVDGIDDTPHNPTAIGPDHHPKP
jgi:hypothetical protein